MVNGKTTVSGFKLKKIAGKIIIYSIIILLALVCIIPLYWMVRSSFMKTTEIYMMDPFIVWPEVMQWKNYKDALTFVPFLKYAANTITILTGSLAGVLLTSSLAAYAFSRVEWKGRSVCFFLILTTMMLPSSVTIVPQFMIWK